MLNKELSSQIHHTDHLRTKKYLKCKIGRNNVLTIQKAKLALKTKFAPFLMSVWRKVAADAGRGPAHRAPGARRGARGAARPQGARRGARDAGRPQGWWAPRYVPGELCAVGLYGWFEFRNTVYTLSTFASFSKNGIKSKSSESVMSSNHDATGTALSGWNI